MKSVIIYTLLFAIFLQATGCYSFYPLEKDKSIKEYPEQDNRLEFRLKSGDYVKASSEECVFVDRPGNHIFGLGTLLNRKTQDEEAFRGEVKMELVDSVKNIVVDSKKYVCCWLKDSTEILFQENIVLIITPETAPDFWLIINECTPKIIYTRDIDEIQVEKLNTTRSVIVGVLYAAGVVLFFVLVGELSKALQHGANTTPIK
jgi:hypothetical protein